MRPLEQSGSSDGGSEKSLEQTKKSSETGGGRGNPFPVVASLRIAELRVLLAVRQTSLPERPDGRARRMHRAGPTDASSRPDRCFGQARNTKRGNSNGNSAWSCWRLASRSGGQRAPSPSRTRLASRAEVLRESVQPGKSSCRCTDSSCRADISRGGEMHRRSSPSEGTFAEGEPEGRASVCETRRVLRVMSNVL